MNIGFLYHHIYLIPLSLDPHKRMLEKLKLDPIDDLGVSLAIFEFTVPECNLSFEPRF